MGSSGGSSEHFLRHLSSSDGGSSSAPHQQLQREWECGGTGTGTGSRRGSRRWSSSRKKAARARGHRRFCRTEEAAAAGRKRVMVVVDQSSGAKHAMMWALTHVANRGDFLTLLHVLPPQSGSRTAAGGGRGAAEDASALANSLGALCKACKPEVEVEALVIQGPKLSTILSQVKKLEPGGVRAGAQPAQALAFLLLPAEQQRGGGGGVHQPGGVPDAGGAAAEQGRRRLPRQHPVAEELLAPRLIHPQGLADEVALPSQAKLFTRPISNHYRIC